MLDADQLSRPTYTKTYAVGEFVPMTGSVVLKGNAGEQRGLSASQAWQRGEDVDVLTMEPVGYDGASFDGASVSGTVGLRDKAELQRFRQMLGGRRTYVDITSMSFLVWGPLVQALLLSDLDLRAIYVEAHAYRQSTNPLPSQHFDLTAGFDGIVQVPGFISLDDADGEMLVVPLLGFEGQRFARILNEPFCQPDYVIPIVGAPGFRTRFPLISLTENAAPLIESASWTRTRYARSNCPFAAANCILAIARSRSEHLRLIPIGTRPHALGAVLAAMELGERADLVYDRPRKKTGRTVGAGTMLEYNLRQHWADVSS